MDPKPSWFAHFAKKTSTLAGKPAAFGAAFGLILVWVLSGPLFGYSDTWQLVINTTTTIVTFLMVFLIQNSQNRDSEAVQIKLDELLRAQKAASNTLMDIEDMSDEELDRIREQFVKLAEREKTQSPEKQNA